MKTLEQERDEAEVIIRQRCDNSSSPFSTRTFDCGRLGMAVWRYDYLTGMIVDWLSWTHCNTLNVPGLDLP